MNGIIHYNIVDDQAAIHTDFQEILNKTNGKITSDKPLHEIVTNMELLHKLLYIRKPVGRVEIQHLTLSLVEKWNVEAEASHALKGEKDITENGYYENL